MKCFHGTNKTNLDLILSGSICKEHSVWEVSGYDSCLYVFPLDKYASEECIEDESEEDQLESIINRTLGQSLYSVVMHGSFPIVIELEIPDDLLQDDHSCPTMAQIASYIDFDDFNLSMITRIHYCDNYNEYMRLPLLKEYISNSLIDQYAIDQDILDALDFIEVNENLYEYISELTYYTEEYKGE